jgi:plastocyanin
MKKLAFIAVAVILAIGAWAVFAMNGVDKLGKKVASTPAPTQTEVQTTPSVGSEVNNITVEGTNFAFTPNKINLKSGQKTVITFKNMGQAPHNLVIADLGVTTETIGGGKETMVEFTPTKSGEFEFICSVGDHEEKGMVGEAIVE